MKITKMQPVGKWHLGHCDTRYTPANRGFDTFLGSYSGAVDHWSREGGLAGRKGYDLRNGTQISQYGKDLYSADLYARYHLNWFVYVG